MRSPFPLQWPAGWKRTTSRYSSKFEKGRGFNAARDGTLNELKLFRARQVVITSNLPTNSKGLPTSTSSGVLADPGIAVWWVDRNGSERVIACDRWRTAVENMHTIELSIAAFRGIDRWGATDIVDRAFAGFAALPAAGETGGRGWRDVFGLPDCQRLEVARTAFRALMMTNHPDRGGSTERAAELNAAMAAAEEELK